MQYAFLIGSLFLFLIWLFIFLKLKLKENKTEMIQASFATSLLGLTEPIFVPDYWNPPTLFDLAQKTRFDIESLIFAFAVGGIAVSAYEIFYKQEHRKITMHEMHNQRHRFHLWALLASPISFMFFFVLTPLNPIYSTMLSLTIGALATFYCRPDLVKKMITSAIIFFLIYFLFFVMFNILFPGYTQQVWNLKALSRILIIGVPIEELGFAFALGLMWSSIYEHIKWQKLA
mgnify:CR=1 FL=1